MEAEKLNAYGKSKTLAEKAAWDYVKELPGTSADDSYFCTVNVHALRRIVYILHI